MDNEIEVRPKAPETFQPVGGFFALAIEDVPPTPDSVWQEWTRNFGSVSTFGSGRGAMAALIGAIAPPRVWLPAYFCGKTAHAVAIAAARVSAEIQTYGITDGLEPDFRSLNAQLAPRDLVIVVDYFGWPPSRPFIDWARERTDIVWIEDRAQALWTADPPWASWCIFSPRKLLGVPNGGVLLGKVVPEPAADARALTDLTIALPELMRFEDRTEAHNDRWYAAYKERERTFDHGSAPMSRLTESLLHRIPIAPLVSARQANYRYLLDRLRHLAAWPRSAENVAPFGFVIAVEDSSSLARQLIEERLFCARHWPDVGSDPALFPYEQALSRHLLTLPCDHRYGPEQLTRLADAVERLAPKPGCIRRN